MAVIGRPIFVVPADLGTVVADNAASGYPVHSLNQHKAIGTTWRTSTTGAHWVRGQFDAATRVNFMAMIAANAVAGTKIRLRLGNSQAEVDGSAPYDSGALDFIATAPLVAPDDSLYHSHLEMPSVVTATWWRIDITGHTGVFEASMLVLGEKIQQAGRYYNSGFGEGVQDLGDIDFGPFGVPAETEGDVWRTLEFTLSWISEAEFEATFRPLMRRLGSRGIIYCCFDPTDSEYRQARTYMGWLRKPLFARNAKKPRNFEQEYSILSFI